MPDTIAATALLDSTSKILESMFFATVFGEAGQPSAGADMIGASVTFDGRLRGSLAVATDSETARTLAADFLALESKDLVDRDRAQETIGELANMICGVTLSAFDDEALFALAHPASGPDAVSRAIAGDGAHWFLDIGEGTLAVCLRLES